MKYISHILVFILGALVCSLLKCDPKIIEVTDKSKEAQLYTQINESNKSKELFKKEAEKLNKEVSYLKSKRSKIVYKKEFDTLATIDTVIVELVKCDSVVAIGDSIIEKQSEQIETIGDALTESENAQVIQDSLLKIKELEVSKQQKKLTKVKTNNTIKTGIIVILNAASIASPPTAIITSGISILLAIIPFNKK